MTIENELAKAQEKGLIHRKLKAIRKGQWTAPEITAITYELAREISQKIPIEFEKGTLVVDTSNGLCLKVLSVRGNILSIRGLNDISPQIKTNCNTKNT